MKVIVPFSNKGGVGRTTVSYNLAIGLAKLGNRVVFIDADGQGNATYALGMENEPCLYNLLVRHDKPEGEWKAVLRQTPVENLYLVPGNGETFNVADRVKETVFMRLLREIESFADVVMFDLSPSFARIHQAAVNAADFIIIPTDPEIFGAINGVQRAVEAAESAIEMKQLAGLPSAVILGVLVNRVQNVNLHESIINHLKAQRINVLEAIPERASIKYAVLERQSIFDYDPKSDVAVKLWNVVNLLQERIHAQE